ncbi:unnamed protein product [Symbiodinium sp. KB8]|nr:unnamed protein product [Symbiodinium sp. KB8]
MSWSGLLKSAPSGLQIAGVLGASGILLGAFGSHALPKILAKREDLVGGTPQEFIEIWKTAVLYQLLHAVALASSPNWPVQSRAIGIGLMSVGVALFSGSCYAVALAGDRAVGKLAPYGGYCMIFGWLALLWP